ncbi:hypothetical protein [Streptomyces cellostaticus]|uniref:hypothetical protein n=1 Tax=Streptomyces TaxID=1883 RepID=UPI0020265DB7|nr:hypothetical protein [Streptomyces cellostaticus]
MEYHPDDITALDTVNYLRMGESRFFRSGTYDAVELAGMIATEALTLGAETVHIQSERDWLVVTADKDWLGPYGQEAFHTITPFPEAGVNGMLAEALAVAFSAGVITITRTGSTVIKGEGAPPSPLLGRNAVRAFAFRRRREI